MEGWTNLEIAKLGELLPTIIQKTGKWLSLQMGDFMSADIPPLGKSLFADITLEGLFACMATLMGLVIG